MYQGPLMPFLPVEITAPFSQENAGTRTAAGVCDAGMSVCQVSPFQFNPCARVRLSKGTKFSVHDKRESYLFTSEIICPVIPGAQMERAAHLTKMPPMSPNFTLWPFQGSKAPSANLRGLLPQSAQEGWLKDK